MPNIRHAMNRDRYRGSLYDIHGIDFAAGRRSVYGPSTPAAEILSQNVESTLPPRPSRPSRSWSYSTRSADAPGRLTCTVNGRPAASVDLLVADRLARRNRRP